ncbi:MAG: hypothetical protein L3J56_09160 [Bacteroidales bacterium]|nr:hypothetical protein [Bacteroidales bacterium]
MDIKKLNNAIETIKDNLGKGLSACDMRMTGSGQSVAGFNTDPKVTDLLEQVTGYVSKMLKDTGLPRLKDYYLMDLEGDILSIVLMIDNYQWSALINKNEINLGFLLNIAIPDAHSALMKALK